MGGHFLNLLLIYTSFKLEEESQKSYLGYLWWVIEPALNICIYFLLFKVILNRGGADYIQFLIIGVIVWRWLNISVTKSANSILSKASLIKKVNIHKIVFPLSETLAVFVKFMTIFIFVFVCFSFSYGITIYHTLIFLPLISMFIFIAGFGLFLSSIFPLIPDLKLFLPHFLRLLFYPSGVLFNVYDLPSDLQFFIKLNPIVGSIQSFRNILMYKSSPEFFSLSILSALGIFLYILGYWILKKNGKRYAKIVI